MEADMSEDLVTVYRPRDEVTANIIKITLEDAGIPAEVQPFQSSMFDGIFTLSQGAWGEVRVAQDDVERAVAVLKDYAEQNKDQEREEQ
jgi:hypothetical protein